MRTKCLCYTKKVCKSQGQVSRVCTVKDFDYGVNDKIIFGDV